MLFLFGAFRDNNEANVLMFPAKAGPLVIIEANVMELSAKAGSPEIIEANVLEFPARPPHR